jgi:putative nucleotidyltransferase with HDIG domain
MILEKETVKKLYSEIDLRLLRDEAPAEFLNSISMLPEFKAFPFNMLPDLKRTEQSPVHHPEGNVWNHTMLVINEAAKRRDQSAHPRAFMWAALLHDIGKPSTTRERKGRITAYNHDSKGAELSRNFLRAFGEDEDFVNRVAALVRYHMQILYVVKDMPFKDIAGIRGNSDVAEIALLGLCDRLGRTGVDSDFEEEQIKMFIQRCNDYKGGDKTSGKGRNEKTRP